MDEVLKNALEADSVQGSRRHAGRRLDPRPAEARGGPPGDASDPRLTGSRTARRRRLLGVHGAAGACGGWWTDGTAPTVRLDVPAPRPWSRR
jgi:hypothetical protein